MSIKPHHAWTQIEVIPAIVYSINAAKLNDNIHVQTQSRQDVTNLQQNITNEQYYENRTFQLPVNSGTHIQRSHTDQTCATNSFFTYCINKTLSSSLHLWNQLPDSFHQPLHSSLVLIHLLHLSTHLRHHHHSAAITLSLQAQNLPFQQIIPTLTDFW